MLRDGGSVTDASLGMTIQLVHSVGRPRVVVLAHAPREEPVNGI